MCITKEQADKIIEGQQTIIEGMDKLLALFTLEPINDATNPILSIKEAANLLGTSIPFLSEACKNNEVP